MACRSSSSIARTGLRAAIERSHEHLKVRNALVASLRSCGENTPFGKGERLHVRKMAEASCPSGHESMHIGPDGRAAFLRSSCQAFADGLVSLVTKKAANCSLDFLGTLRDLAKIQGVSDAQLARQFAVAVCLTLQRIDGHAKRQVFLEQAALADLQGRSFVGELVGWFEDSGELDGAMVKALHDALFHGLSDEQLSTVPGGISTRALLNASAMRCAIRERDTDTPAVAPATSNRRLARAHL